MTYCFAWTYKGSAYVLADTLTTGGAPRPVEAITNFNEGQGASADGIHEESLLKIREIGPGVVIASAGDVDSFWNFIDFLQENFALLCNLDQLFAAAAASCGPFDEDKSFESLVLLSRPDADAIVLHWDTEDCRLREVAYKSIGSLDDEYKCLTERFIRHASTKNPDFDQMLYTGIGLVQAYGRHVDIVRMHVGGTVLGARVTNGQTHWQDDTVTVIYTHEPRIDGFVCTLFREGCAIVDSSYRREALSVFVPRDSNGRDWIKPWEVRNMGYAIAYLSTNFVNCNRWIFISRDSYLVTVVHIESGGINTAREYLTAVRDTGTGSLVLGLRQQFVNMLLRTPAGSGMDFHAVQIT